MNDRDNRRGNPDGLTRDQSEALYTRVLPTAERWVREYPKGSPLWTHGQQTLAYWGALRGAAE